MQGANIHKRILILFLGMLATSLSAQTVTANLITPVKTVQVGKPFEVELSVTHPERTVVIFPDSAKDFKPYEVESGKAMPTRTDEGISVDSKIYQIYTWEIDSVQTLIFPVKYLDAKGDTVKILSNAIQVEFQPVIAAYSDTLKVKVIGELAEVREPINWAAWGVIITGLLLFLVVLGIVFFKPIRKAFRRARIEREWRR